MMDVKRIAKWGMVGLLSAGGLMGGSVDSRLADAVKERNNAGVRSLLQQHVDVNAPQNTGMTALHWAAYQDDLVTAEILVRAGANVKAVNRYGVTPLSSACENGNGAMVELFLKAGGDANTVLPGGETALMTAARTGKTEAIKALLSHGADPNAKVSQTGQTALMWAAAEGNVQAVETLIEAGADYRARENRGFTPLLYAVRNGRSEVVRLLLKAGVNVNEPFQPIFRFRPKEDMHGHVPPKPGTSALVLAVVNGHFELAAQLLDAGANPNDATLGWTPMHAIARIRKPGIGNNPPAPRGSGKMTSLEFVKKLVEHGANLNARMTKSVEGASGLNTKGATPFLMAAKTGDAELMRYLAKLGADPLIPNADGSTPLMVAAGLGTRAPGDDAGTEAEVVEAIQVALDLGNDINAVDKNGETAVHGAAYKNLPGVVQFLVDKGSKIEVWNQKNKMGWTPLLIAEGYRIGDFKPDPETVAVFQKIMAGAGVSTVIDTPSRVCDIYQKEKACADK